MLKEFKEFINKGNVMDLAIGVIMGGAFGKIVASLVNDMLMPLIGKLLGGINFTELYVSLDGTSYPTLAAAEEAGAAVLKYGSFIQAVVDFLIISFAIFIFVKQLNKMKKPVEAPAPTIKACPYCKTEIAIDAVKCPNCTSNLE